MQFRLKHTVAAGTALAVVGLVGLAAMIAQAQFRVPKFVSATATAPKTVAAGKSFTLVVDIDVSKPYHIQANPAKKDYIATEVKIDNVPGLTVGKASYPKGQNFTIAGETLPVYEGQVKVKVQVAVDKDAKPGKVTLPITIHYQGCNDKTCYPPSDVKTEAAVTVNAAPSKKKAHLNNPVVLAQADPGPTPGSTGEEAVTVPGFHATKITQFEPPKDFLKWLKEGGSQAGKADDVTSLLKRGGAGNFALALGLIYLLGLALNLTPCVYPVIPITIGYFGRQAASGAKTGGLSVCYALGMALMYSILGLFAALFGKVFGAQLDNPVVLVIFAILMFALGLSMFDRPDGRPIWELQLPQSLTSKARSRAGYAGALLMGLMVGVVAAPCIGPIVVALIKVVGDAQSVPLGLVTFFTLGIGLATPYLMLGFGLIRALPRAGEWMVAVKHIFGLMLFGMSLYYLRGLFHAHPGVYRLLVTAFAVASGLYLLFLDKSGQSAARFQMFKRVLGVAAIGVGIWLFLPKADQNTGVASPTTSTTIAFVAPRDYADFQARLAQAKAAHKEVLIDFWATWCAECKELDEQTFHNPEVAKASGDFVALRVDLEDPNNDTGRPYRDLFKIVGLPTVVHLVPADSGVNTALALR